MAFRTSGIAFVLLGSLSSASAAPSGRVTGRVFDGQDETPLVGAAVVVSGTTLGALTDGEGAFALDRVPAGYVLVTAHLTGYRAQSRNLTLSGGDTMELVFRLEPTVIQGTPLVVTASRRLQELRQSPTAMDIVTPEQITARNAGIAGALDYVPGATVIGSQVSIRGSSGYTQGAGSRVGVLVDGVSVLTADVGDVKWELVPPEVIERIEVAKGPSSALYGSGALGGVINQITRQLGDRPETRLRIAAGWYANPKGYVSPPGRQYYTTISVTHAERVGETKMLANIHRDQTTGARAGGDNKRYNLFLKLERPWDAATEYGFLGIYSHENHGNTLQSYPDSLHYTRANGSRVIGPEQFASAWIRQVHGAHLSWRIGTHFYRSAFDEVNANLEPNRSSDAIMVGAEGQVIWMAHPGLTMTLGAAAQNSWIDAVLFQGKRLGDLGAYGQAEIRPFPISSFIAGVHYDRRSSDVTDARDQVSPRVGVVVTPTGSTTLRALLSKGFRGPAISELSTDTDEGDLAIRPNPMLVPERSWSAEVGLSQTYGRFLGVDVGAFESRYEDLLEPTIQDTTDPGTGRLLAKYQNIAKARVRGFEAAGRVALFRDHVRVNGSYMFLDARNQSPEQTRNTGPDSLRLPYRPRHTVKAGLELRYGRHFAGYDYRYASSYPVTVYPNDPRVPQIISDARIGTQWRRITFTFAVTNLFNYVYAPRERKLTDPRQYSLCIDASL